MGGGGLDCGIGVREGKGFACQPGPKLVHKPRTCRIAGLAKDNVECGVVEIGEVRGEEAFDMLSRARSKKGLGQH